MDTALNEITLVLFTTIAPAGVVGYIVMAFEVLLSSEKLKAEKVSHYLVIPLVLVISGLIASATHLGTPANALYVLTGIGRSPLSNEVVAAVTFLALGGVYWIVSFRDDIQRGLRIAWLSVTIVAGLVLLGFIAVAYSVPSVPTWSLPTATLTLWLNAFSSGPMIGLLGLMLAQGTPKPARSVMVLGVLACAAIANIVIHIVEWNSLADIVTTTTRAIDLFPAFPAVIAAYGALELLAVALGAWVLFKPEAVSPDPFAAARKKPKPQTKRIVLIGLATVAVLVASFLVRFAFYALHMTSGV